MKRNSQGRFENTVCFLCDWWWLILLLLFLIVAAILTRCYWLPDSCSTQLGSGDVQVTLRWSGYNDLDLHVTDPFGEELFYQHTSSDSGGLLDVDSNAGCERTVTNNPVENIYWPTGSAPTGEYTISVVYFLHCGTEPEETPFRIQLKVEGETQTFEGSISQAGERIVVTGFTR